MTINVTVNINNSQNNAGITREYIDLIYIIVCSTQILIGLICNIISLKVFMRSGKCSPIILQRHSLILLTLSNTFYLIVFFYSQILLKLSNLNNLLDVSTIEFVSKIYISNHSVFVCKSVQYLINVAICLNASITTSFSLERAFAIKFPYMSINLRENHDVQFKILIAGLLLFSFLLPSYNLHFVTIVDAQQRCSVDDKDSQIYFYLTVPYMLFSVLLPFLIISFSNYTIIKEIVKNNREHRRRTITNIQPLTAPDNDALCNNSVPKDVDINHRLKTNLSENEARIIPLIPPTATRLNKQIPNIVPIPRVSSHITTNMLIAISMSWLILNLPYIITWSIFTLHIALYSPDVDKQFLIFMATIKTVAEMFVLMNYSMAGLLYFVSGKMYREHLYDILGCATRRKRLSLSRVL